MKSSKHGISGFTSIQARETFQRKYVETLHRLWPVPFRTEDVATRSGTVRVYRSGPRGTLPIVLLGGPGGFAASWYKNAGALSLGREVIAVDPLGELGLSVQTAAVETAEDAVGWLDELLTATGSQGGHLVGSSTGAWLALNHQLQTGQGASALTLIEPPGLQPQRAYFGCWLLAGKLAARLPGGLRQRAARRLRNGALADRELGRLARAGDGFRRRLPAPGLLADRQLAAVRIPTTLLLGEHSAQYDRTAVLGRLEGTAPGIHAETVPGTGHAVAIERPDVVSAAVLAH
ncbi:MAG: alpha/beta fold hydrolase [Actinomycetota bacterium]|nr:alpha/beta fold hydrolase [Actinomycetota bacterium]